MNKYQIYLLNREGTWSYTVYKHTDGMLDPIIDSDQVTIVETIRCKSGFTSRETALNSARTMIECEEERLRGQV